jgi:hypothetical protein
MWIRRAYLRIQRLLPFLTVGFIQKMMTVRLLLKLYIAK